MSLYSFKQNCKVYLSDGISSWQIQVYPDLNFSQTFEEQTQNVKTLHDQFSMFENAIINKANVANFNFTVFLSKGDDFNVLGDWLTNRVNSSSDGMLKTYNVYVDTGVDIFCLNVAVAQRATFQIVRNQIITVSIEGSAALLYRFGSSGTTIPGIVQTRDSTVIPIIPTRNIIELDSVILPNIVGFTLEFSSDVSWLEYNTLHKSLYVTSATDTQYPEAFVVSKQILSGTIQQYLTDDNGSRVGSWSTSSTLRIRTGDTDGYFLDVNIPIAKVTNRLEVNDVFLQSYDFRMIYNPTTISDVLKYNL